MAVLPLLIPLVLSSITFDLQLTHLKGVPLTILSPSRNLSLSIVGHSLVADTIPIASVQVGQLISLSIECLSDTSVHISTNDANALVHSPSICSKAHGILINESSLYGCISNMYRESKLLVSKICGTGKLETTTPAAGTLQPVYVAEPLEVNEGASMPLQWKNVYVLPEHSRLNISNKDILFSVVEGPTHGQLLLDGVPTSTFHYGHLLSRSVLYKHDGSETTHDHFDFQLEMPAKTVDLPWLDTSSYTLNIRINAVNDAPEMTETKMGQVIKISARGSRVLSSDHLLLSDPDDGPDKVRVQVVEARGVHLRVGEQRVNEFTQRQLINRQVSLHDEGVFERGLLRMVARDSDSRSQVLSMHIVSTPIEVRMKVNTGVRLLHHAAAPITNLNLSFSASIPDLPLSFSLVGLPSHGVIECSPPDGHFAVCSKFSQIQIDRGLVRFRHTSSHLPTHDTFSFQVESGDFVSMVHNFRIMFTPMNVKVFNREVFLLNGTESGVLSRQNLFAWTFPKNFAAHQLVYHIEEPPKYGILSRKMGKRNRRIGVSSNFTQQDLDAGLIQYQLHFLQFSIVNDFFLFRVVCPAVSSESQRFEIVFVPSPSSIQLINRTVVVHEGKTAVISSDSLSLSTPDDKNFVFSVTIPPQHGTLMLKVSGGGSRSIGQGANFTTKQIIDGSVLYSHSDSESRTDRLYLSAESAFRPGRRFPLWMSFSVILHNDNPPRLDGNSVIQMVERGERILYRDLLNWVDDDIDGTPLILRFDQPMKDAAILSTVSPYLPTTSFSMNDVMEGRVMIRHLGHKNNFSIPYTVTDGAHTVTSVLQIIASEPFVRVQSASVEYCCLPGDSPMIVLQPSNLSILSNMDVRPADVLYSTAATSFHLRDEQRKWTVAQRFTQKDIISGNIAYQVRGVEKEELSIRVGDRTLLAEFSISRRSLGSTLELKRSEALALPVGGAAVIDKNHLEQGDGATPAERLWFDVIRLPQEGSLVLESESSHIPHLSVTRFTQQDVDLGLVQYVHGSSGAGRDAVEFNISSPHTTKGPFTLYIDIYEHHVSLSTDSLSVVTGGSAVLSTGIVNVTSSDRDDYIVKVITAPSYGWIVKGSWSTANISSVDSFSGADLRERRVVYVSDATQTSSIDQITVVACISHHTCTQPAAVDIQLIRRNEQSPHLLRNEVLRVSGDKSLITNSHLDTEDPDTPPSSLFFLISRPSTGMVVRVDDLSHAIFNFSQKDIDDDLIAYVNNNASSGSGGFSFLLSDGVHQVGPEWFSIDTWSGSSALLEANARLVAPPATATIIGIDLLRANLPSARPDEVLFSITKKPKHGKILLDGSESDKFSQNDINRKLVWYSSVGARQKDWTRKDSFAFVVTRNGSGRPVEQEFRFRISSTYAALTDDVEKLVTTTALVVSKGGSAALNQSHLSLDALVKSAENEVLLLEVGKPPRHGSLDWLEGGRGVVSASEYRRGITAVYTHHGEDSRDDSVMFFVYPVSETTRRSSRLRITLNIRVTSLRDPLVQISQFAPSISLPNSGSVDISSTDFSATHPHVPPQSIVYEVIQTGTIGAHIRVNGKGESRLFSQEEVNRGLVSVSHSPVAGAASSSDVIGLSVEGHSRALIVRIRPLDLTLENHTTIEYPQGKTYVVLNRSHLGAFSNGNREKIMYKVTSGPENGTFYWVAGEKEAKQFSQQDIDEGRVLYAQLNMHSYGDSFEFVLANDDRDMVRNRSEIRVRSLVEVQPVIVEAGSATPLTSSQLNATQLQGSTPRFLITSPPSHGRVSLDPETNHSALFFTFPDILRGRVYYQAFPTDKEVTEHLELEVRADSVQPARITLDITIIPSDEAVEERKEAGGERGAKEKEVPRLVPGNGQIPAALLIGILFVTVVVLICMNRKKKPKEVPRQLTPPRLPPTPRESISTEKQDLLDTTVFASVGAVGGRCEQPRPAMKTFERSNSAAAATTSSVAMTPSSKRRHPPSLDYAGLTCDAPPVMPLFKQLAAKHQNDSQYWV